MSEPKFKAGDRVLLRIRSPYSKAEVGATGTVLETDTDPWIRFDAPTGYGVCASTRHPTGWKKGHMACIPQERLELIP